MKKRIYITPGIIVTPMMTDELMVSIGASREAYGTANESEWSSGSDDEGPQQGTSSKSNKNDLWSDPGTTEPSNMPSLW